MSEDGRCGSPGGLHQPHKERRGSDAGEDISDPDKVCLSRQVLKAEVGDSSILGNASGPLQNIPQPRNNDLELSAHGQAALAYAHLGFSVLPCEWRSDRKDFKTPFGLLVGRDKGENGQPIKNSGGVKKATTDEAKIRSWWKRFPDALVAIAMGADGGVICIDIDNDPEKGKNGDASLRLLKERLGVTFDTPAQETTPRGGRHLFFAWAPELEIKNSASGIAPHLDIKTEGGYVIVSPSTLKDGRSYDGMKPEQLKAARDTPLPPAFIENFQTLIAEEKARKKVEAGKAPKGTGSTTLSQKPTRGRPTGKTTILNQWAAEVSEAVEGTRNDTLSKAAWALGREGVARDKVVTALSEACRAWDNWEEEEAKSLDTIERQYAEGLATRDKEEADALKRMNDRFFVVAHAGKTYVGEFVSTEVTPGKFRDELTLGKFQAFKDRYMNVSAPGRRFVPLGDWWLAHLKRRQYDGFAFIPGGPALLPGNRLNQWRGWGVEPKKGDWSLLRRHIATIMANGDNASDDYIMRWLAWAVQHPDMQAEVFLVFQGRKGTGKGILGRAMMKLFGAAGLQISSSGHLTGRFNAHLDGTCFLFADEAFYAGDKAGEGQLKRLATEDTLLIERKGQDAYSTPNRLHVMMASNEDWVIPASLDDRRFAMFEVSEARKQDEAYFKPIFAQLEAEGYAAMLHDLLAFELGDWHPRRIVRTAALRSQQERSLNPLEAWWLWLLKDGVLHGASPKRPNKAVQRLSVGSGGLYDHAMIVIPRLHKYTDNDLGEFLKKKGIKKWKDSQGKRGWEFPPLSELRSKWEEEAGEYDWDDDLTEWEAAPGSSSGDM